MDWRDYIILALEELSNHTGGLGYSLADIYASVERIRTSELGDDSWKTDTWKEMIHSTIENYCDTSEVFDVNSLNLFVCVANGIWGLDCDYKETPFIPYGMTEPNTAHKRGKLIEYKARRYKRSYALPRLLRRLHNDTCQISGDRLCGTRGTSYAEVHHIMPLSSGGPDITDNMVVVTPNMHALLDRFMCPIDIKTICSHIQHEIRSEFVEWHNHQYNQILKK